MRLPHNDEDIPCGEPELGARSTDFFVSSNHRQHQSPRLTAQTGGGEPLTGERRMGSKAHPLDRHLRDAGDGVEAQAPG